jgi:hypothetical protein
MTKRTAYLAIQCTASTGEVGTYLYSGDHPRTGELLSPVMSDSVALYDWCDRNCWARQAYDPAHPCGVYVKADADLGPAVVPQQCQQQQACAGGDAYSEAMRRIAERDRERDRATGTTAAHRAAAKVRSRKSARLYLAIMEWESGLFNARVKAADDVEARDHLAKAYPDATVHRLIATGGR